MRAVFARHGRRNISEFKHLGGYSDIYKYSIEENDDFWATLARSRLDWHKDFSKVSESSFREGQISWFADGKLNVFDNCVTRHLATRGDQPALIWEKDEPGDHEVVTFRQLSSLVNKFANVLRQQGVKKGDRVAIYYPVSTMGVAAMLACAKIGAVHSVVFAGFSSDALRQRIIDADCQVVICVDGTFRGGRYIDLKDTVDSAVDGLDSVRSVLVGTRNPEVNKLTTRKDIDLDLALENASDIAESEVLSAEDPLFLLYTSGSTGTPKGLVHSQAGYLLYAAVTTAEVFNCRPGDIFGCVADIGWITGHTYTVYGPLANGATTLLFEAVPTYPDPGRYWATVEKHKVTQFYGAPTAYRSLARCDDKFVNKYDTSSLKVIGSVGEPINTESWHWLYEKVGREKVPIADTWWQTETGGNMITPVPCDSGATFKPGSAQRPFYGVEPVLRCSEGHVVEGNSVNGSLCIARPWPGIARTIFGDHGRFREAYLNVFDGVYTTGDGAHRDSDGEYTITGRMDDVINVAGKRLGTAEIEDCLSDLDFISEAAVVGVPHDVKGEVPYAFVILKGNVEESPEHKNLTNQHVAKVIAKFAVPQDTIIVNGLPKTRSGKIMRRILRKIASSTTTNYEEIAPELGDISTLAEPEVVKEIFSKRSQSIS